MPFLEERGTHRSGGHEPGGGRSRDLPKRLRGGSWLFAAVFLLVALGLQLISGAYRAEVGSISSDEGAHFVSGLMVRDYLVSAPGTNPVDYALNYYAHYPKVAIGNWPPVFHAIQGIWMVLLPPRPASVLFLLAAMGAGISSILFVLLRKALGWPCAAFASLLFLLLPPVPAFLGAVMAEVPLALFVTLALVCWIRFVASGRPRDAVAFGGFALLACLTKGNGLLLGLVPPLAILLGRHRRLLRARVLWGVAGVGLLLVLPWTWFFFDVVREGWSSVGFSAAYTLDALVGYPLRLVRLLGVTVTAVVAVGIWSGLRPAREEADRAIWSAATATILAVLLFHSLIPSGIGSRHLILAFPFAAMLAALGIRTTATALQRWLEPGAALLVVMVITATGFFAGPFRLPPRDLHGYGAAAEVVRALGAPGPTTTLAASDAIGESAFIVEVAVRDPDRPGDTVWRSSKLLASMTWAGRDYILRARSGAAVLQLLDEAGVRWVVRDRAAISSPHLRLLDRTIAERPDRFRLRQRLPVVRPDRVQGGEILVYEVGGPPPGGRVPRLRQQPGYLGVDTLSANRGTSPPGALPRARR
jgi:4-amino-4-deoxy-L-arabinose transferase-like glycosyltransferase